jgi:hypothetical protein
MSSLTSVPQGMVKTMAAKRGPLMSKSVKGRRKKNIRLGVTVARFYNEMASRPIPRNGISLEQQITAEMTYSTSLLTTSASGLVVGGSLYFVVSGFSGATSALSVFDQYKFEQVEVWMDPTAPQGTTTFGQVVTCVDLDDATAPTLVSQVQDHQESLPSVGGAGHYHKWKPHMAVAVYSGTFASFANEPANWIDSASPNVQHYGFKAATSSFVAAINYDITVRAVISFRAPFIA